VCVNVSVSHTSVGIRKFTVEANNSESEAEQSPLLPQDKSEVIHQMIGGLTSYQRENKK